VIPEPLYVYTDAIRRLTRQRDRLAARNGAALRLIDEFRRPCRQPLQSVVTVDDSPSWGPVHDCGRCEECRARKMLDELGLTLRGHRDD
jgi:hypothetical protein